MMVPPIQQIRHHRRRLSGIAAGIAFRIAASANGVSGYNLAIPSQIRTGDIIVLFRASFQNTNFIAPAGWTTLGNIQTISGPDIQPYYRIATSGDPGSTLTLTNADGRNEIGILVAYSNPVGTAAQSTVGSSTGGGSATSLACQTLTTPAPNCFVIEAWCVGFSGAPTITVQPANARAIVGPVTMPTGEGSMCVSDQFQAVAGPSTAQTAQSNIADIWVSVTTSIH